MGLDVVPDLDLDGLEIALGRLGLTLTGMRRSRAPLRALASTAGVMVMWVLCKWLRSNFMLRNRKGAQVSRVGPSLSDSHSGWSQIALARGFALPRRSAFLLTTR